MKSKLFIIVIVIIAVIGIYIYSVGMFQTFTTKVQAPTIQQEQAQSSSAENMTSGTEGMTGAEMMSGGQMPASEKMSKSIVNYTDGGFSPSSLEIKVGQTVQFANQSGGGMWVASGPHPTHTIYPEFDAKRSAPNGGIYEFTFTKVGQWKYHNHTKPSAFGTIIVK